MLTLLAFDRPFLLHKGQEISSDALGCQFSIWKTHTNLCAAHHTGQGLLIVDRNMWRAQEGITRAIGWANMRYTGNYSVSFICGLSPPVSMIVPRSLIMSTESA